jgi:glycosyltransferase involved in cell wall biosynthesis
MDGPLKVTYYGNVFAATGYGEAARASIHALHGAGVSLSVVDLLRHGRQVRDDLIESLLGRPLQPDFHLFHGIPPQWAPFAFPLANAIGFTVWETDTMPTQWHNVLSHVVDLWLPSSFNVETFGHGLGRSAFLLPHPIVSRRINDERTDIDRLTAGPGDFVFYSIFEWQDRKGPRELLRAYCGAFREQGDTILLLKVNPGAAAVAAATIEAVRRETGSTARARAIAEVWTPGQIEALHGRGNCYVSLHRGEGWGYPLFDAAARGIPTIATAFSAPLDYLAPDTAHLIPYELVPVRQRYLYYTPHMKWARPDVEAAARAMRAVREDPGPARARAADLAARIRAAYSPDRIGAMGEQRLRELAETRARAAARPAHLSAAPAAPPAPRPPDWYDADYFEHGIKSNWTGGYSWSRFSGLFRQTARWLTELFPAATFLDAGCGKGFLVRALREMDRECWGFDHSPWAIDHADPAAKPFVRRLPAEELTADPVDVTVALDLLSLLTETQAEAFLAAARTCTRQAMLAVINTREPHEAMAARDPKDRDRSHITLKPRAWWHELFLHTGWRLDALQRLGSGACQAHPLPRRMRWHVYAYAPE